MRKFIPIAAPALAFATAQAGATRDLTPASKRSTPRGGSGRNITFS
jgi:hypothetical protein